MKDDFKTIAICWSSDLSAYERALLAAVKECAETIPGNIFRVIGTSELFRFVDANDILRSSVDITRNGWIINPKETVELLNRFNDKTGKPYNIVILLTHLDTYTREFRSGRMAIGNLKDAENAFEIEKLATFMLKHILGHIFINTDIHCSCSWCAMHSLEDHEVIMQLAECEPTDLYSYCPKCQTFMAASPFWGDEPSAIEIL